MPNKYDDHAWVLGQLKKSQDADEDMRQEARDAHLFLSKKDGQWEPYWYNQNKDKPRYTFDLTTPIINQISEKIRQADFAGTVNPIGGDSSKKIAAIYEGIIRKIQSMSNATEIYNASARGMVIGGLDGWRVVQRYADSDSFDQDLMVDNIENFLDRVWFDCTAEAQDRSDASFAWVFTGFSKEEYKSKWPEGGAVGLSVNSSGNAYFNKPDLIMVGEFYYIKKENRELVLMSNGAVYEDNEEFQKIKDELQDLQIVEIKRRKRKKDVVYVRKMDESGWLDDEAKTVFEYIPIIPTFGNFQIFENKTLYSGAVAKRMDPQRVFNYSASREIEEGALAPRAKYWGTPAQREGHEPSIATLNTNSDPWQDYNPDPEALGPPTMQGGAQINPGLRVISETMSGLISQTAGLFAPNLGDNPRAQSGVAIEKLQMKGDIGSSQYFASQEVAIRHTMRILVKAIPKVMVGERRVQILSEEGKPDNVVLNEKILDQETGKAVYINNLAEGNYDVVCSAGPAFQNRQQETVSAMVEIGQVDPSIIALGGDVLLNNITSPGMKQVSERKRAELFKAGLLPKSQWTKEEAAAAQEQGQQKTPTPDEMIGQAEIIKAQNEQKKTDISVEEKSAKIQLAQQESLRKDQELILKQQKQQFDNDSAIFDYIKKQADTLKVITDALGIKAIVSTEAEAVVNNQIEGVAKGQDLV